MLAEFSNHVCCWTCDDASDGEQCEHVVDWWHCVYVNATTWTLSCLATCSAVAGRLYDSIFRTGELRCFSQWQHRLVLCMYRPCIWHQIAGAKFSGQQTIFCQHGVRYHWPWTFATTQGSRSRSVDVLSILGITILTVSPALNSWAVCCFLQSYNLLIHFAAEYMESYARLQILDCPLANNLIQNVAVFRQQNNSHSVTHHCECYWPR